MIGLLIDWQADAADMRAARRFTASLGAGLAKPVIHQDEGAAVLAGTSLAARDRQRWRAVPVAGGGWLAFTGVIFNLAELRRHLDRQHGDAVELYAEGYARWGDAVDLRAIGEFASIIAFPGERLVRAARSPIAAPPLHLRHGTHRTVIASTARAVLAGADLQEEVDEQKIADSLLLNYADPERGWYRHVRRLDVGTHVRLIPGTLRKVRYYDLFAAPPVRLKHDDDYVAAAGALLAEGTRLALDGYERPAISLSGGLDSQAVAASALAERPRERLLGLTSVPEPGLPPNINSSVFEDERHHVAALAAMYPALESELVDAAGATLDHRLSAMFLMGGIVPRNVLNFPWLHAVYERARTADCDVLLTGAMGNLGFSFDGEGALPSWLARGRWFRLARELGAQRGEAGWLRTAARAAVYPLLPLAGHMRRSRGAADALPDWCPIGADYARTMRVRERADALRHTWSSTRSKRMAMVAQAGNELGDIRQGFMAIHGIPMRDPTAYRPLLEFCMGIPDDQFVRDGRTRWLARRMLRNRIPDMVVDETRQARQAADGPIKLGRMHAALIDDLDALARDPAMAARFDLPNLRATLAGWAPGVRFPSAKTATLRLALPRVLATAQFIRYVEGKNG